MNESSHQSIDCCRNDWSIYQAIDRFIDRLIFGSIGKKIYQSIGRSLPNSLNRPDARGNTKASGRRGHVKDFAKKEKRKKYIHPEARARAAGACLPLYYKYSAPRARLVYLLWTKGNCYSMTRRICKRSFGKFPTD